jgi:hypothetical protein
MRSVLAVALFLLSFTFSVSPVSAQTGRISGAVTDAESGDPLPGVNIVIEGTTQGATTNAEGRYAILNVSPGTYTVQASFVGYATQVVENVRVNIDLTTTVDFELQEEAVGLEEVVVQSQEPIVKPDISANVANLSAAEMENIPVSSLSEVVGLQAGVQGLSVRGGGADQLQIMVDGLSMRDGRTNEPYSGISYTSVEEVQVQTGGFSAEYGNVRSGLVNVVTKEGPRDRYTADVITRYTAPSRKYFMPGGIGPEHSDSYFMRPHLDEDVAFVGTHTSESPWDRYKREQYPRFQGWNAISEEMNNDDNPDNDLTPEQAQEVFEWHHRKSFDIETPDYVIDGSVGGPIPVVSDPLGDLRFFLSYREVQTAYAIPMNRDAFRQRTGQAKVTSNITPGMKLTMQGLYGRETGIHSGAGFSSGIYRSATANARPGVDGDNLYGNDTKSLGDIDRSLVGSKFTHTLSSNTFYELKLQRMYSRYLAGPDRVRNTETVVETIGPMELDEAPFGWEFAPRRGLAGLRLSGHWSEGTDSSKVAVWSTNVNVTHQVAQYLQFKGGLSYIYSNYHVNHKNKDFFNVPYSNKYEWSGTPRQGAAYLQSKMEFEGLIANAGLRVDYFDPKRSWYQFHPYSRAFSAITGRGITQVDELDDIEPAQPERQLYLGPRLGVSFPITTNSKLFFNYGHFRQMLNPQDIFNVRVNTQGQVTEIGNPNHPMPLTIAYELGYEHNLFDQYLVRLTGYYRALGNQPRGVGFESLDGAVEYELSLPFNYADIRGFEVSLQKNVGRWLRGFLNYTFMVEKSGNFGFAQYHENRAEHLQFVRNSRAHYQETPIPQPYARTNIELLTPPGFGPELGGINPLGNWVLSLLSSWQSGHVFTWTGGGGGIVGLENNVRWKDDWNLDLRLNKYVESSIGQIQFFVDMSNALNLKRMHPSAGFADSEDYRNYMSSLHLPEDTFADIEGAPYSFIPGNDRAGEFREAGVDFVPIEVVSSLPSEGISRTQGHYGPLYYVENENDYYVWDGGSFAKADAGRVEQVLEDKAYIDMPNISYLTFFHPRQVTFGLRLSF